MTYIVSTIADIEVCRRTGEAVRQRREALGFSLRTLAARSGISPSMISDIERGEKAPTVVTLVRLAEALGTAAASLLDAAADAPSRIRLQRHAEAPKGLKPAPWTGLVPGIDGTRIDVVRYELPPATVLGPTAGHAAGTLEHLHLESGALRVTVGGESVDLAAGDGCSCRTDVPHAIENLDRSANALFYLVVERPS